MEFIKANESDLDFLYRLRNEDECVRYSKRGYLSKEKIREDYFYNSGKMVFLGKEDNETVSYLIFRLLSQDSAEISIAIDTNHRKKGLGNILVREGTEFAIKKLGFKTIVAQVFPENKASMKIFQNNAYKIINTSKEPWELIYKKERENIYIFDFDGVIADSLKSLYSAYLRFLETYSITGNKKEFNLLNGPKLSEIISYLKNKYSLPVSFSNLEKVYSELIREEYKNIDLCPGIPDLLTYLSQQNLKTLLASSSKSEDIQYVLEKYNLSGFFEYIIGGEQLESAKPSPEIYLKIKEKYPDYEYYVIEDSENGIKSANAADMNCIFYNPHNTAVNFKEKYNFEIKEISELKFISEQIEQNCFLIAETNDIELNFIQSEPEINSDDLANIEKIWANANKYMNLFNGGVLQYHSHSLINNKLIINTYISQYKFFFSKLASAYSDFRIKIISVSGIIVDSGMNTLIAVRQNVTEYPGYYELIPSGTIDPLLVKANHIKSQLSIEFEEESRISKDKISKIELISLIYDKNHGVYDICAKIYLDELLVNLLKKDSNQEYKNIQVIKLAEISKIAEKERFVPTSVIILKSMGLI